MKHRISNETISRHILLHIKCSDFWVMSSDFRLPTSDFRLPTSDFRLPTSDFRLPTSDFRLPTSDSRLPTPDSRLPTSDFRLPTPDFRLPTSDFRLPRRRVRRFAKSAAASLRRRFTMVRSVADVSRWAGSVTKSITVWTRLTRDGWVVCNTSGTRARTHARTHARTRARTHARIEGVAMRVEAWKGVAQGDKGSVDLGTHLVTGRRAVTMWRRNA